MPLKKFANIHVKILASGYLYEKTISQIIDLKDSHDRTTEIYCNFSFEDNSRSENKGNI